MDTNDAIRVIESLRKGIPPDGYVRAFTVGRESEIKTLTQRLKDNTSGALLLKANYGSGKTHLLRLVREHALAEEHLVSAVTLDAKAAVRFNRMDQILGAICRNIELPASSGCKGIRIFFDYLVDQIEQAKDSPSNAFWKRLTNSGKWDYSDALDSPALFVALRAWATGVKAAQDTVEDWLAQPWNWKTQRRELFHRLVEKLRTYFRDPRSPRQFYADDVFLFDRQGYQQSWALLRDLHRLARASHLKGFVILFDEFEDVVTNLNNVAHQESAFWNLFQFFAGKSFPGPSFYAVTPEFADKCIHLLFNKDRWDYDFSWFESLAHFQMTPLEVEELEELAMRIMEAHGKAYEWEPDLVMKGSQLDKIVGTAAAVQIQDRARHTIKEVVKALDNLLQDDGDDGSLADSEETDHLGNLSDNELKHLNPGAKSQADLRQLRSKLWRICRLTELLKLTLHKSWLAALKCVEEQLFTSLSPESAKAIRRKDQESFAALEDSTDRAWLSSHVETLCTEVKASIDLDRHSHVDRAK